jgi:hypothetical protein
MKLWHCAALLALTLAGCAKEDPIVGTWRFGGPNAGQGLIFKPDGTAAADVAALERRLDQRPGPKIAPEERRKILDRLAQSRMRWKKLGTIYQLNARLPGAVQRDPAYFKVEGDELIPCTAEGKPLSGAPATRVR